MPDGTLIYSSIVAHHRLWGHKGRRTTLRRIIGEARYHPLSLFETRAVNIAIAHFGSSECAREILLKNSVVGFYARVLHENLEANVLRDLLNGDTSVALRYFSRERPGGLTPRRLRWCKACAAQDLSEDGRTHWYVVHQLPLVTHCHRHYTALVETCKLCRTRSDDGRRWLLPGDGCACIHLQTRLREPSEKPLKDDDPYRQLLNDITLVFSGRFHGMRPSSWRAIVQAAAKESGSVELACKKFAVALTRNWKISQQKTIASRILDLVAGDQLQREFQLLTKPTDLLLRLAVLGAANNLQLSNQPSVESANGELGDDPDPLIAQVESLGFPAGAASMLRAGKSIREIHRAIGTTAKNLHRVLVDLPKGTQKELADERQKTQYPTSATPFNLTNKSSSDEQKRSIYRKKILYLVRVVGLNSRHQITVRLGGRPITWLFQHDRDWLESNLPPKRPRMRSKKD